MYNVLSGSFRLHQLVAIVAMAAAAGTGHAQPQAAAGPASAATVRIAELEQIFWTCDWQATAEGLDAGQFSVCAVAADELKQRKFSGDFDRMLDWWRQNKPAAHAKLQASSQLAAARR